MNNNIKVSVIMSTYKTPIEFMEKAIQSILQQTYRNFEFIIVCDGDKEEHDSIKKINDARIKIIFHKENMGLAKSLNDAIDVATGKYIIRMDSDDISLKNRIKKQVNYMEKHPNIIVSYMQALCFGKKNGIKYTFNRKPSELEIQILYMNCLVHPATIIRKNFLDKNKIRYNEGFKCSQDYELWTRIVDNKNISEIPQIGLLYRIHNNQISRQKQQLQMELKEKIIRENNLLKIENENKKILNTLLDLSGNTEITKEKCNELIEGIQYVIKKNKKFNRKTLEKVLYNRFFQIFLTNLKTRKECISILKSKKARKMIFRVNNLMYIINKIYMKNKAKFLKKILIR